MALDIDYRSYRRPFISPLRTARGEWAVREGFILRVVGDAGVGFGEVAPIPEFGSETLEEARAFLCQLVEEPDLSPPASLPCCAFALSAASLGAATNPGVYPVSGLLPAGPAAVDCLRAKIQAGATNFKWKVGVEPTPDEQTTFGELCELLPKGAQVRLDANGSWDLDTLESWVGFIEPYAGQFDYFEQPLPVGQEAEMAVAMQQSGLPIALDESLQGSEGVQWLEPHAWRGPLVVKPALMGDVVLLGRLLQPVERQVVLSSVFETAVGVANVLAFSESLPGLSRPFGFDTATAFNDSLSLQSELASLSLKQYNAESLWETLPPHSN